jgi:hypothetical protein
MSTEVQTAATRRAERRDRISLAVVLGTAGAMFLTDRLSPGWPFGDAAALVIGLELLAWAVLARAAGLLVAGGVLTGVGTAIVLVSGPLQGSDAGQVGGVWFAALGMGFALVAGLARPLRIDAQDWAWIPAGCLVVAGAAIGFGVTAALFAWGGPVALLGVAAWLLLRRRR